MWNSWRGGNENPHFITDSYERGSLLDTWSSAVGASHEVYSKSKCYSYSKQTTFMKLMHARKKNATGGGGGSAKVSFQLHSRYHTLALTSSKWHIFIFPISFRVFSTRSRRARRASSFWFTTRRTLIHISPVSLSIVSSYSHKTAFISSQQKNNSNIST